MKRLRSLLAICLALMLVVAPFSAGWADSVTPTDPGDGKPVDSGHPWDDEATETADPENPDGSLAVVRHLDGRYQSYVSLPVVTTSGSRWLGNAVLYLWQRAANSRMFLKSRTH